MRAPLGGGYSRLCDPMLERALSLGDSRSAFARLYDLNVVVPLAHGFDVLAGWARAYGPFPRLVRVNRLGIVAPSGTSASSPVVVQNQAPQRRGRFFVELALQ